MFYFKIIQVNIIYWANTKFKRYRNYIQGLSPCRLLNSSKFQIPKESIKERHYNVLLTKYNLVFEKSFIIIKLKILVVPQIIHIIRLYKLFKIYHLIYKKDRVEELFSENTKLSRLSINLPICQKFTEEMKIKILWC